MNKRIKNKMKKRMNYNWKNWIAVLVLLVLGSGIAQAQYEEDAKLVLDKMSAKYKKIASFSASITYALDNDEDDIHDSFTAKIGIKGTKFRMLAEGQEIIITDGTIWSYLSEENEVNIDDYTPDDDDVTPSNIYTIYKKGYKYMIFGEEKIDGKLYDVVDLSPEKEDGDYFRIRLYLGKTNSILRRFAMYAKSGNRYTYDITDFNQNVGLSDDYFVFNPSNYEDVEVVDLRIDN